MVYSVFSIYDRVTGVYSEPFLAVNSAVAVRRFNYLMSQSDMVSADCQLFKVGTFDITSGLFEIPDRPVFECNYEVENNG